MNPNINTANSHHKNYTNTETQTSWLKHLTHEHNLQKWHQYQIARHIKSVPNTKTTHVTNTPQPRISQHQQRNSSTHEINQNRFTSPNCKTHNDTYHKKPTTRDNKNTNTSIDHQPQSRHKEDLKIKR